MSLYQLITIIIVITALFAIINNRLLKLPASIGIMVLSLSVSVLIVLLGNLVPGIADLITGFVKTVDFRSLLMNFMLSFLLFAGTLKIDAKAFKRQRTTILLMSSLGILISTSVIGTLIYLLFSVFNRPVDFIYCLLFGALISPTDPIAALGILTKTAIPRSFRVKITGESLLNDGFAIVVFLTIMSVAETKGELFSLPHLFLLFFRETGGGILLGSIIGYLGFQIMRLIDNYQSEVLLTLAMVMGGTMLAEILEVSGPIAMATAGIITGNKAIETAMSEQTKDYLNKFWEIIDYLMNAVLFLLIGLEMLVIRVNATLVMIGLITFVIVLVSRFISVLIPVSLKGLFATFERNSVLILTWGALRGAISVAMALSLPESMHHTEFVTITYTIVILSIILQGLTVNKFVQAFYQKKGSHSRWRSLPE